jgi:hypothetical protein
MIGGEENQDNIVPIVVAGTLTESKCDDSPLLASNISGALSAESLSSDALTQEQGKTCVEDKVELGSQTNSANQLKNSAERKQLKQANIINFKGVDHEIRVETGRDYICGYFPGSSDKKAAKIYGLGTHIRMNIDQSNEFDLGMTMTFKTTDGDTMFFLGAWFLTTTQVYEALLVDCDQVSSFI